MDVWVKPRSNILGEVFCAFLQLEISSILDTISLKGNCQDRSYCCVMWKEVVVAVVKVITTFTTTPPPSPPTTLCVTQEKLGTSGAPIAPCSSSAGLMHWFTNVPCVKVVG